MTLPTEYREWLDKNLNWFERLRRKFSPEDEAYDFMCTMLLDIATQLKSPVAAPTSIDGNIEGLVSQLAILNTDLAALIAAFGGEVPSPAGIDVINFRREVAVEEGIELYELVPSAGHIFKVFIHWPSGCNALVEVRLKHGTVQFCPNVPPDGTLALDDVTLPLEFNEPVVVGEKLFCEIINRDSVNSHTISAIALVRRLQ